jgi:hypothetical protein
MEGTQVKRSLFSCLLLIFFFHKYLYIAMKSPVHTYISQRSVYIIGYTYVHNMYIHT